MVETQLIEKKDLREQAINNIEVLDKVKKLFLIPEMEVMTTKMVADYYEVPVETIKKCYQNNKEEINSDGVVLYKSSLDFLKGQIAPTRIQAENGRKVIEYKDFTLVIPNCNIKVFPQRAVLRIGMLLRDSAVAKEVRNQLLNVFEHSTDEQKIVEIDKELELKTNIGIAYASGNADDLLKATMEYQNYRNRYIKQIEEENIKLSNLNKELETTNALLTRKTMEWGNKPILNALVRKYALVCFSRDKNKFPDAWHSLYRQVKYKYGFDIMARNTAKKMIDRIKEDEFSDVIKVAASLCEANNIDVGKTVNSINADNIESLNK